MPAYFTTSRTSKKNTQKKKPGWEKRKAEHDAWLLKVGAHPSQIKNKKLQGVVKLPWDANGYVVRETPHYPSLNSNVLGACTKKEPMVYSGERKLLGIATLHKSNMVPVFDEQDAKDIARMRRG